MSDWLLNALREAFVTHGLQGDVADGALALPDQLRVQPRVSEREVVNGAAQVQVDFAVESPRLAQPMVDSFAGVGASRDEAEKNAFGKFLQGSFHVIAESLTDHRCDADQVDWDEWAAAGGHAWRVCSGPVLSVATRGGARIEGFTAFFDDLSALFARRMPAGPHWMRVFVGALDGERRGREVLVDGVEWPEAEELLETHAWTYPPGYASLRHLLVALPR
jgi:hypothetical protein